MAVFIVYDQEQYLTLASYPNGSPRLQEFRGPLIIRYTNAATGESAVRDLSGYAWFHYQPAEAQGAHRQPYRVMVHTTNCGSMRHGRPFAGRSWSVPLFPAVPEHRGWPASRCLCWMSSRSALDLVRVLREVAS